MSIASELNNLEGNIEDSYDAVNDMGGIIPAQRNMDNLDQAIRTIPQSQGTTYTAGYGIDIDQNDEISVDTTVIAEKTDIPTATSDLTNDSGFITSADLPTKTSDLTNDGSDGSSTYVEADDLATVATSGSYNDLSNKPTIPAAQVNSDWNASSGVAQILNKPTLATVATSGSYNDLTDKPTIPEPMVVYVNASFATPSSIIEVYSDSALSVPADPEDMADIISAGGTVVAVYDGGQAQERIELSSVNSNSRFPEIGHTFTSTISTSAVFSAPTVVTLLYDDYNGVWSVETTAVTAVNDATLTIQHNGTDVQTFTANQSTNATANIETIWADDIEATTPVPAVETAMIADGAVTNDKIANSTIASGKIDWTTTSIASAPTIVSTVSNYITLNTGYSVQYNNVYTLGKIVIMNLIIKADSGYPNGSQVNIGSLTSAFKPAYNNINTYVGLGDEWSCNTIGYCYISAGNGAVHIRSDAAGKTFARLNLVYVRV